MDGRMMEALVWVGSGVQESEEPRRDAVRSSCCVLHKSARGRCYTLETQRVKYVRVATPSFGCGRMRAVRGRLRDQVKGAFESAEVKGGEEDERVNAWVAEKERGRGGGACVLFLRVLGGMQQEMHDTRLCLAVTDFLSLFLTRLGTSYLPYFRSRNCTETIAILRQLHFCRTWRGGALTIDRSCLESNRGRAVLCESGAGDGRRPVSE
ncbi:hypothetical protein V8C44DRAFT_12210 [Trichoderma aethiopicum]